MLFPIIFLSSLGLFLWWWPRFLDRRLAAKRAEKARRAMRAAKAYTRAIQRQDPFANWDERNKL
jgi:hypothetical protein